MVAKAFVEIALVAVYIFYNIFADNLAILDKEIMKTFEIR